MKLVATAQLTSNASSISFTNIPQDADDLFVIVQIRNHISSNGDVVTRLNADTAANYTSRRLTGNGGTVTGAVDSTFGWILTNGATTTSDTADTFGYAALYVPNYRSSVEKVGSQRSQRIWNNTSPFINIASHRWTGTAAITSLEFIPNGGAATGSTAYLYTITKA
jgi:hypothetical protein